MTWEDEVAVHSFGDENKTKAKENDGGFSPDTDFPGSQNIIRQEQPRDKKEPDEGKEQDNQRVEELSSLEGFVVDRLVVSCDLDSEP